MIKKLLVVGLLLLLSQAAYAYEFPIVKLKSGGDFTSYNTITTDKEFDRIINFDNVAIIRKFGEVSLLVDGHINIKFNEAKDRERFLSEYVSYQQTK